MKLRGESYRAVTQVKGMSPEITIVSEVETVHNGADSRPVAEEIGEETGTRRGLRP